MYLNKRMLYVSNLEFRYIYDMRMRRENFRQLANTYTNIFTLREQYGGGQIWGNCFPHRNSPTLWLILNLLLTQLIRVLESSRALQRKHRT